MNIELEKAWQWLRENRNDLSRVDTDGFVKLFADAMSSEQRPHIS